MPFVLYCLASLFVLGCQPSRDGPPTVTRDYLDYQLRQIRNAIDRHLAEMGELPSGLNTVCPEMRGGDTCPFWLPGDSLLDPWDRSFVYEIIDAEYVLGSAGPDTIVGTSDDILIRPSVERSRVEAAAGCYRVDLTWLSGIPGDTILQLDTAAAVTAQYAYLASPSIDRYVGAPAWRPLGRDSLIVEWVEIHHAVHLRLAILGDSLAGTTRAELGLASWWGSPFRPRSIGGRRIMCEDQ